MYPSFHDLLGLVFGGVTLHNALQYVLKRVTAPVVSAAQKVAADVESGNAKALKHDAHGVVDFVETHDPELAKAIESKYAAIKSDVEAEVAKARHSAAEELRKLAESVEKATGASAPAPAPVAPQAPAQV
jgi:hypothetical protein